MKKVIAFGTFDKLHLGHKNFLKQAREYGELTVVVARDETVKMVKGRQPENNEKKRFAELKKINLAGKIILGGLDDPYEIIKKEKPDVICLGYDQEHFINDLPEKLKEYNLDVRIVRLKPFKENIYKSSKIKSN